MTAQLDRYHEKRDLDASPEPSGGRGEGEAHFVIQKHDASSLHYDLRLEVDGVLVSWAVPKGPSTDPRERRLALRTEDHPLDYADFEGVIPEEEYGGGTVLLWDRGPYRNLRQKEADTASMSEALEEGKLEVWLEGEKISGGYALIRTDDEGEGARWLLIKMDDDEADARRNPTSTEPESVASDRDLDAIRAAEKDAREVVRETPENA